MLAATAAIAEDLRITGVAKDPSGATIGQATVELSGDDQFQATSSDLSVATDYLVTRRVVVIGDADLFGIEPIGGV